jgi:hypothetical protein
MPVIPALGSQRQEDFKFEASLDYTVKSSLIYPHQKTKQNKKPKTNSYPHKFQL